MPIAKVQLEDGRIARFEVPEGTTPEQVQSFAAQQFAGQKRAAIPRLQDVGQVQEGMVVDTGDGPAVFEGGQFRAIPQSEALTRLQQQGQQRAGDVAREAVLDPNIVERGAVLPVGKTATGESVLAAPEFLAELGRAAAIPGAIAEGAPFGSEEITDVATIASPNPKDAVSKVSRVARNLPKKLVDKAPSTTKLLKRGSRFIENYKKTGDNVSGDDFSTFWVKADDLLKKEGFDAENTPAIARRMNSLAKRAEADEITAQEMINIRRGIGDTIDDVANSAEDKRLATILMEELDDFVVTLPGTEKWAKGRRIYSKGLKSRRIMDALDMAGEAASGLENGVRIEVRKILRNKRERQRFSKSEVELMKRIVKGDFTANTLKRLAGLGFGSGAQMNRLGGGVAAGAGGGIGAVTGGPVGAFAGAAIPGTIGGAASKALEKRTVNAVKNLRALIAGAKLPEEVIFKDTLLTPRMLSAFTAGAAIPEEEE